MKDICIVIPSLNPDEKLERVVKGVMDVGFSNIVLVDDGSSPENKKFFPKLEGVTLLVHEINRGKGAALKTAIRYIIDNMPNVSGIVTCDGDGQHTSYDTLKVAESMKETGKFTLGVRDFSLDNVPARSRIGNRLSSVALLICSGNYISDTQTGLRGIPASLFEPMCDVSGDRFEYETNVLLELKNMGAEYKEVKIETVYLENNKSSHFRPFHDTVKIMSLMLKYCASSTISFAADILLFTLLHKFCTAGILVSTIVARLISSVVNFFLNKKLVFKTSASVKKTLVRYYALAIPTMLVSAFATKLFALLFAVPESSLIVTLIKIVVDILIFVFNFRVQKRWVFKKG